MRGALGAGRDVKETAKTIPFLGVRRTHKRSISAGGGGQAGRSIRR